MTAHALKGDRERCLERRHGRLHQQAVARRELETLIRHWIPAGAQLDGSSQAAA